MKDQIQTEVERAALRLKAYRLMELLMGANPHGERRELGGFVIYRQVNDVEITHTVTIGSGGLVLLYADRRVGEDTPNRCVGGNYIDHKVPALIEALERALILHRLAEI
jgi:hypothetical protein